MLHSLCNIGNIQWGVDALLCVLISINATLSCGSTQDKCLSQMCCLLYIFWFKVCQTLFNRLYAFLCGDIKDNNAIFKSFHQHHIKLHHCYFYLFQNGHNDAVEYVSSAKDYFPGIPPLQFLIICNREWHRSLHQRHLDCHPKSFVL